MPAQQRQRFGVDLGQHHLAHELRMRRSGLFRPMQAHGLGGKAHVVGHVQRAGLVVGKEFFIAARKLVGIGPADLRGELAPSEIGVDAQQRMVQVKKR